MSDVLIFTPDESVTITAPDSAPVKITSTQPTITVGVGGTPGPVGPPGPMGPSGTEVVAVPYEAWPPADPQSNTLYLRLAP